MQELSKMTDTYSKAAVGYERIQEILQTDDEVHDLRGAMSSGLVVDFIPGAVPAA